MQYLSRRAFLAQSSLAVAGLRSGAIAWRDTRPVGPQLPWRSKAPVGSFFPELIDSTVLRQLAQTAVGAAREAGAAYADIRVSDARQLQIVQSIPVEPFSTMTFDCTYGIRVRVGGAWGFAFGTAMHVDEMTRAAREAVATTRGIVNIAGPVREWPVVPPVTGEWATPVTIDPFSVSPDEHAELLGAYQDTMARVPDAGSASWIRFTWERETRVFASTEGTLLTQRFTRVVPQVQVEVWPPLKSTTVLPVPGITPQSAGFECVVGAAIQDRIKETAEEAARLSRYPEAEVTLGRYETILDGAAVGAVLATTLARALEPNRAFGDEADSVGTSVLSPVDDILGASLFSPKLTILCDRTALRYGAAKWDDEGIKTAPFPVIQQGRVVNYFTTRASVSRMMKGSQSGATTLYGSAIAGGANVSPIGCAADLVVSAGAPGTTLEAMASQLTDGMLVYGVEYNTGVYTDQQLAGGILKPWILFEVKRGKITRRLQGGSIQFVTKRLWSEIAHVGDVSTLQHHMHAEHRGETWVETKAQIVAPAIRFDRLDVMQSPRRSV